MALTFWRDLEEFLKRRASITDTLLCMIKKSLKNNHYKALIASPCNNYIELASYIPQKEDF